MRTRIIPRESDLHRKLIRRLESRIRLAETQRSDQESKWQRAEDTILAYVPATKEDQSREAEKNRGNPRYTTMMIPYSYALLMTAHTYWTSVFFGRDPVHQFQGRHGEGESQIQAMEALVSYQVLVGKMMAPYYIWLYDAGKYGLGVLGTYWCQEMVQYSTIEEDPNGGGGKFQVTKQVPGYMGNKVYNVSPFDFLPDPRVTVGNFQQGEFCGCKKRIPWNEIVKRQAQGYYMNLEHIKTVVGTEDPGDDAHSTLKRPGQTNYQPDDQDLTHPPILRGYEIYVEILPKEWELGGSTYPEKWVFTITHDKSLIIGAQPMGSMHDKFPFDVLEVEVEGYGMFNRGILDTMAPIQDTVDWLLNSHFYNVRSSLNNIWVADPTRIVMKDLQSGEPGRIIRVKPEGYGSDIDSMIKQIPVTDVTTQNVNDLNTMFGIGERVAGINDQVMGALNAGGRKTATEVRTSTGFSVNRLKTTSEYMSHTGFTSHAEKLVANSQQFYGVPMKLRIVGDLAGEAGLKFIDVRPEDVAGAYDLVPINGTLPVDRMALANLWKEVLLGMRQMPDIAMQYDLTRIFAWFATLSGLRNINRFKKPVMIDPLTGQPIPMGFNAQVAPDETLAREAERGNLEPVKPPGPDSRGTGVSYNGMGNGGPA